MTSRAAVRPPPQLSLPVLNNLRSRRVILASQSPRRKRLLDLLGLHNVEVVPSAFAEDLSKSLLPFDYVLQTATQKAITVYEREVNNADKGGPALVIAADTVVVGHFGEIMEKPTSECQHVEMLRKLRDDGPHKVLTGVACIAPLETAQEPGYALETQFEETTVRFDGDVTDELLLAYARTREGADKAGGYAAQGLGSILIEGIEGSFDNAVGLPLRATLRLIEKVIMPDEQLSDGSEGD